MIAMDPCRLAASMLTALFILLAGCAGQQKATGVNAWSQDFSPPTALDTSRMHLEPLGPQHAKLDLEASLSSRRHLQDTLHWGSWPQPDMTVEENRRDLVHHDQEFKSHEGYAYTVLRPDRPKCLGCVYVSPLEGDPHAANVAYWVIESELATDLDKHLLATLLNWFRAKWPFDEVVMSLHRDNRRGIRLAEEFGLTRRGDTDDEHVTYVWHRS